MNLSKATETYASYLNGLSFAVAQFDFEELQAYRQDLAKARAEMDNAWLASKPVLESD